MPLEILEAQINAYIQAQTRARDDQQKVNARLYNQVTFMT